MTIDQERREALKRTLEFLGDLCDPKATPGVSRAIRSRALSCLRHYPWSFQIEQLEFPRSTHEDPTVANLDPQARAETSVKT